MDVAAILQSKGKNIVTARPDAKTAEVVRKLKDERIGALAGKPICLHQIDSIWSDSALGRPIRHRPSGARDFVPPVETGIARN